MLIIAPEQEANRDIFSIFFNMNVYCVFSLGSPHQCDSKEYTQHTIINIKKSPLTHADIMLVFPRDSRTSSKQP